MIGARPRAFAIALILATPAPLQPRTATRVHFAVDYGIRLRTPAGLTVCIGRSPEHWHGFMYDAYPPYNCDMLEKSGPNRTTVGIWAEFNTVPWSFRHYVRLMCQGRKVALTPAQRAKLKFRGLKTAQCATQDKDGILVYAMTERGSWAEWHTSCAQYYAYLATEPGRLEKDLPALETFLKRVTIEPVTCGVR